MQNEIIISIIVPVYNAEKYLSTCINSILMQTYANFELILVDDGSKDNSGTICNEYVQKDNRIKVIHQKNAGANKARQNGVNHSHGSWIAFIDADDSFYDKFVLEKLLLRAITDKADIVLGASLDIYPDGKSKININKVGSGTYDSIEYVKILLMEQCIYGPACKIIKRNLFSNNIFQLPKHVYQHEDMFMNISLGLSANRISIDNNIIAYNYIVSSPTSFQTSKGLMPPEAWITLFNAIKKILIEQNSYMNLSFEYSQYVHKFIYLSMLIRQKCFPRYNELSLPVYTNFERMIRMLNRYPMLWSVYFQVWRILFVIKNVFK